MLRNILLPIKLILLICVAATALGSLLAAQSDEEIRKKINQAEWDRENNLARYVDTETYQLYHDNGEKIGGTEYKVTYIKGQGKKYQRQKPYEFPWYNSWYNAWGLKTIVDGQAELSRPDIRKTILPTSDNYHMDLVDVGREPQPDPICKFDRPARRTRVLKITPKKTSPYLIDGYLWVDADNYHVVRIEGWFSEPPRKELGATRFERDYIDRDGFAMATSNCDVSTGLLKRKLQITYDNYDFSH